MSEPPGGYRVPPITTRARDDAAERGPVRTAAALAGWAARHAAGLAGAVPGRRAGFELGGRRHRYLVHRHKATWLSERAVEVPVVAAELEARPGARTLEVGHVLGHYGIRGHEVVDKYERAPGVRNVDVLELRPAEPYELIVSISTLEHVGWDDPPRDPARAVAAVEHLRGLLTPGGTLLATVPLGYNPELVAAVRDRRAGFSEVRALARDGAGMRWREVEPDAVWDEPYDRLLYRARAVLLCRATP